MAPPIVPPPSVGGVGVFSLGLMDFYAHKSVLPSWKFMVEFVPSITLKDLNVRRYLGAMRYHHVIDVSLPLYKFRTEKTMYGPIPKTFPVIDHEGFNVKITFEDDRKGNVLAMVHALQRTIVKESGVYKRLPEVIVGDIIIHLFNHFGTEVGHWIANKVYYLGADDLTLSYGRDDTMKFGVNFGCDTIRFRKNTVAFI